MTRWLPGSRGGIAMRSPVPLVSTARSSLYGYRPSTDMATYLATYSNDAVVHPIVSRLSEAAAEADWQLWTKSKSGDKQDRTRVTSHAVLDLLAHPNDFQTFAEIIESFVQHFFLVGEGNIVLGFEGLKIPVDMWVIQPDRIQPVPDAYKFLRGWVYTAPGAGERIPLETRELMRTRRPDPTDPYRGMGAIQALLRDLDAQRYTKEWQANFFLNSARPGGMIKVDRRLGDDEFLEMSTRWAEQHQGVSKAHRVAILEQAEWVENAFSLKDLQIAELDQVGRDKALVAFGFPKSALGIVEDVNRANAEAGEYLFARWLIRPLLARIKAMLNHQLLALYGNSAKTLELDFADPVPENSEQAITELKTKSDVVVALVGAGFEAPEVLDMVDWPDLTFEKPEPEVIQVPPVKPPIEQSFDNAMRWMVKGHPDDNCCDPCKNNFGKLYRNRSSAYADYPPGRGYAKCVGVKYGNKCRCTVVRRRSNRDE